MFKIKFAKSDEFIVMQGINLKAIKIVNDVYMIFMQSLIKEIADFDN